MTDFDISQFNPRLFEGVKKVKKSRCPLTAEDVQDQDNEIWILQCSNNVDITQVLEGRKINLKGESKLPQENTNTNSKVMYEAIGLPKKKNVDDDDGGSKPTESLVTLLPTEDGELKLVAAPIKGYIVVRERIEDKPIPILSPQQKTVHEIPDGVKIRHPIYGTQQPRKLKRKDRQSVSDSRPKKRTKIR